MAPLALAVLGASGLLVTPAQAVAALGTATLAALGAQR
jgi:hypothetical protein